MADDVRDFDPPRAVEVLHEGVWVPGRMSGWIRWPDGSWKAAVTYTVAPGEAYARQLPEGQVRPRDE